MNLGNLRRRSAARLLAVGVLPLLAIAACGGSGDSGQPAASKAEPIKIGIEYPLTGGFATNGINAKQGALLAVDYVNKTGIKSLGGAKLVPVVADTGTDPATAASTARRLITDDQVKILTAAYLSSFTLTVATEAERAKIPLVTQSFADGLVTRGYKYTFKTTPLGTVFGSNTMSYTHDVLVDAGKSDLKRGIVVDGNDASAITQAKGAVDDATKYGFQIAKNISYPTNLTDATSIVSQIRDSNAQIIFIGGTLADVILILKGMRGIGINIPIVGLGGGGILSADYPAALGAGADGTLSTASWNYDISADSKKVAADYVKKYNAPFMPQEAGSAFNEVMIAAQAMEKAASTDPAKLRTALLALDLKGSFPATVYPGGHIAFDETGMSKHPDTVFIEYQNGKPATVWPKEIQQAKPIFK